MTCSCLPGLKTQRAFTCHRGFHIVARIILTESFRSPRNTSRLLLNSFKTKNTVQGVEASPPPNHWDICIPVQDALSVVPFPSWCLLLFHSNFHPPHLIPPLMSWQTEHFHCQVEGKKDPRTLYPKPY